MTDVHDAEFLDLRQFVYKMWRRRWWLAGSTLVFAVLFGIHAVVSDRFFRAATVLAPAESSGSTAHLGSLLGQMSGLASLAGINVGPSGARVDEALAVLRSREFTTAFFEEEGVLPKLFPEKWDTHARAWKEGMRPPVSRGYVYFDTKLRTIIQNRKTGLVTLQIDWTDPAEAAFWANELVRRLNAEMRARAIAEANSSIAFLEKELANTSIVEMREAINRLIEAQVKQRMLANVNHEYAFRVIDAAVAPEPDEFVRPHRRKLVMIGAILGFVLGALGIALFDYFARKPAHLT